MKGFTNKDDRIPAGDPAELDALLAQLAIAGAGQKAPPRVREYLLTEMQLQAEESFARSGRRNGPLAGALNSPNNPKEPRFGVILPGVWSAAVLTVAIAAASFLILVRPRSPATVPPPAAAAATTAEPTTGGDTQLTPAAEYFSLPYSDPSIANGTEATVHISIPSSQLMAWGVPSPGQEPDEEVPADLILGDDGLPRAIQILPATSSTSEEVYP